MPRLNQSRDGELTTSLPTDLTGHASSKTTKELYDASTVPPMALVPYQAGMSNRAWVRRSAEQLAVRPYGNTI